MYSLIPYIDSGNQADNVNKVLQRDSTMRVAWKIDFNEVLERYVQYIFEEVARRASGRLERNLRYLVGGRNLPRCSLRYL